MEPAASSVHHSWVTVAEGFGVLLFSGIVVIVVTRLMDVGAEALRRRLVQRRRKREGAEVLEQQRRSWWRRIFGG